MPEEKIITMQVVTPPTGEATGQSLSITGNGGPLTYVCGSCATALYAHFSEGQLVQGPDGVTTCGSCGAGNRLPSD